MKGIRIYRGPFCGICREKIPKGHVHKYYPSTLNQPELCIQIDAKYLDDLRRIA